MPDTRELSFLELARMEYGDFLDYVLRVTQHTKFEPINSCFDAKIQSNKLIQLSEDILTLTTLQGYVRELKRSAEFLHDNNAKNEYIDKERHLNSATDALNTKYKAVSKVMTVITEVDKLDFMCSGNIGA